MRKQGCSKQVFALNAEAWNDVLSLGLILLVSEAKTVSKRDGWGHSYLTVRGEILEFVKDGPVRRHLPRMSSLIKNES